MWTRATLKENARFNLKGKYWSAFAVAFIAGILGGTFSGFGSGSGFRMQMDDKGIALPDINLLLVALPFVLLFGLAGMAFTILIGYPVQVGGNRWFSRSREAPATPSVGLMFSLFSGPTYTGTVGGMLWMNLFLFLWGLLAALPMLVLGIVMFTDRSLVLNWPELLRSGNLWNVDRWLSEFGSVRLVLLNVVGFSSLLLSIPAIIKSYSYRMTPWILADNPRIGFRRALRLSMDMTRGHKGAMFILDLSFLGWILLGFLACCIGIIFVVPYIQATYAELYAVLRQNIVLGGLGSMEEFGFIAAGRPNYGGDHHVDTL